MLCSVVVPVYNKAAYLELAITSVLKQTHQDWELILVDDGSTDNSVEVIRRFTDPRIRLVQQPNGGVSRARNRGIDAAKGELVCFLDADDWYGPHYLAAHAEMATRHPDQQYFATCFRWVRDYVAAEWNVAPPQPLPVELVTNFFERRSHDGKMWHTNSIAIRRSVLQAMQPCFPVGESLGEDQDLWFRVGERYPLVYCPLPLVAYRMDVAGSLVITQARRKLTPVYERLEQRALAGHIRGSEGRAALRLVAHARVGIARQHMEAGERGRALAELWRGRRAWSRHWIAAVMMTVAFSPAMARRWNAWRKSRTPELITVNKSTST
ncbi:glycosyltransferase family 2 protein [Pseudoduganella chitinolytica]|uniref:Glycosyltransferase n=1 Tax=Pseudoduganella chitinolytica TaxID=34070 RepID=A0ABY8BMT8_9BURK|nr:glycosyltransferase [Pseudoduganella chitinolytica]WEF35674.1 glycosyltransferase [Pseudoduganella chitinolytica]